MIFRFVFLFLFSFSCIVCIFSENYPDWYIDPIKSKDKFYSVGVAKYSTGELSIEAASIRARKELSSIIKINVSTMIKDFLEESNLKNKNISDDFSQMVSKQISDTVIKGSSVEKIFIDTTTTPATYYILVSINTTDLSKAIENSLINNEKSFSEFKSESSLNNLIDEVKKIKTEDVSQTITKTGKVPDWINNYPSSNDYYVGIGQGKTMQVAKDYAINTLVSQIKVKVRSEINDYIKEAKGFSDEEVTQNIKLTVNESIDDLELIDLYYSQSKNYWAYYRLNIAEYKKKQLILMENAKQSAIDFLKKSLNENDPALAFKYAYTGYAFIGKYITSNLKADLNGKEIIIINELISRMQGIMNSFVITPYNPEILLNKISFKPVEVKFNVTCNNIPLNNFPFRFYIKTGDLKITNYSTTDSKGNTSCIITEITGDQQIHSLVVEPDFIHFLIKSIDDNEEGVIFTERISKLGIPSKEILIKMKDIVFNFSIILKNNFDSNPQYRSKIESLSSNFINAFIRKSKVKFTDGNSDYSLIMEANGNIVKSNISEQYFTRMIITIRILDNNANEELFSKSTPEIKGGNITEIKSMQAACDKFINEYNESMIDKIINYINYK